MDRIIHIGRTREVRLTATRNDVEALKDTLMLQRGVLFSEAERVIGERKISTQKKVTMPSSV
jgi:hypothetical protein